MLCSWKLIHGHYLFICFSYQFNVYYKKKLIHWLNIHRTLTSWNNKSYHKTDIILLTNFNLNLNVQKLKDTIIYAHINGCQKNF